MNNLTFLLANARFLAFGFLLHFATSFGQTYFVGSFGAVWRAEFGLTHGEFGNAYSLATLVSALCLVSIGRLIDRVDLRLYNALACAGAAGACLLMAVASAPWMLVLAMFTLRLVPVGLLMHVSATSMGRYFEAERGRALAFSALGQSAGSAVFPAMGVALTMAIGWRLTWGAGAVACVVVLIPLSLWLLGDHTARHRRYLARLAGVGTGGRGARSWNRAQAVRDPIFHLILSSQLVSAFVGTGIVFHQAHVAAMKGWSMTLFTASFSVYAVVSVVASLVLGSLADRYGSLRLLPFNLLPLGVGLVLLGLFDEPVIVPLFMAFHGFTQGFFRVVFGAVWAEVYGVEHLGAIRAAATAVVVGASALSPAMMGWMFDAGLGVGEAVVLSLVLVVLGTVGAVAASRMAHARQG